MKMTIKSLRKKLALVDGGGLRSAAPDDIQRVIEAGFPSELIDFYRENEPGPDRVEIKQRIWSIKRAIEENEEYTPGYIISKYGYIVFASNMCGDAYCVDLNSTTSQGSHPIVLFPHDVFEEGMSTHEIQKYRLEVATSLADFLDKFTNETLVEEPKYS
jgi:hypothetical protein